MGMLIQLVLVMNIGFGGGAGNPGGTSKSNLQKSPGENGTGGLLVIYTNEFSNNGKISSKGSTGALGAYKGSWASRPGGGGGRRFWWRKYKYFL